MILTRRALLVSVCAAAFAVPQAQAPPPSMAEAFPLSAVRLKPSIFLDAVNANRAYLLSLEPDRFLHNFWTSAGLAPKGELYGGWEARGIAGHSLGHYLSACSLMYAQTGDGSARERVRYIVSELAECQRSHGDGYVGGTTVERNGQVLDGKIVFEEVRRGQVSAGPFDVNGGWVPLYTWHKVHQGLLDAHAHCGDAQALDIARGASDYLIGVLAGLNDEQVQRLLNAEHGGLNETFAEMYARTGERKYLDMAERIRHRAVLDPLSNEQDILAGLHANTQIPKLIGLARLHELTGEEAHARAARFFWATVTRNHSYVIGGNSEREHFAAAHVVAPEVTERTCEACNTYNMLRLTRHLWSWRQDSAYFDYFERAHLNHIMAHQNPATGKFAYFMPLSANARREYSTKDDTFWCCVGSGMESHSKHGESIFWRRGDTLFVNLFVPASLDWRERGARLDLETAYPNGEEVRLRITEPGRGALAVALRLPAWCAASSLLLNGEAVAFERENGYAVVQRAWRAGDVLTLTLPMTLRTEEAPDDPHLVAFLCGPLVLAADCGSADDDAPRIPPALSSLDARRDLGDGAHVYRLEDARPAPLTLKPFYALYERRSSVYLKQVAETEWRDREAAFEAAQAHRAALEARTIDAIQLGEDDSEHAHAYAKNQAELISYAGSSGRQAWWGEGHWIEFDLAVQSGPVALHALYWGDEIDKNFDIKIDDQLIANERRVGPPVQEFVTREYQIPRALTRGKTKVRVRFETRGSDAPVYCLRSVRPERA